MFSVYLGAFLLAKCTTGSLKFTRIDGLSLGCIPLHFRGFCAISTACLRRCQYIFAHTVK